MSAGRAPFDTHAQAVADAVVAALEAGTAPFVRPWAPGAAFGTAPFNPTSGKCYRGGNAVYLGLVAQSHGYDDPRWLTYKQATALGAQVRKGEKSTSVEYWKWPDKLTPADGDAPSAPDAGDAKDKRRGPSVFFARVFNGAQLDGLEPLPAPPELTWARHLEAEAVINRLGVPITHGGDQAYYSPSEDRIQLPSEGLFENMDGFYSVALHECGHATGAKHRCDRDLSHRFGTPGYASEELRAELISMLLSQRLGTGHDPSQHHAYIASWCKLIKDKPRELFHAARDAETACEFLGVGPDYSLTAQAAEMGGAEHGQRLDAESERDTLRRQRDEAAQLVRGLLDRPTAPVVAPNLPDPPAGRRHRPGDHP